MTLSNTLSTRAVHVHKSWANRDLEGNYSGSQARIIILRAIYSLTDRINVQSPLAYGRSISFSHEHRIHSRAGSKSCTRIITERTEYGLCHRRKCYIIRSFQRCFALAPSPKFPQIPRSAVVIRRAVCRPDPFAIRIPVAGTKQRRRIKGFSVRCRLLDCLSACVDSRVLYFWLFAEPRTRPISQLRLALTFARRPN